MKYCTFCSKEHKMLFSHLAHDIGALCVDCYITLHGTCGICSAGFIPGNIQEGMRYRIEAKYINMGEKAIIACNGCFNGIRKEYPELMA